MTYLDYNSTTPVDPRVLDVMLPMFSETFGNPSSKHGTGRHADQIIEDARKKVADAVGMRASDVIFTSGATEANNLALSGLKNGHLDNILVGATEHKSVLQTCHALGEKGHTVTVIPVHNDGTVNLDALEDAMSAGADVVSMMAANSETGVVHPIEQIAELAHRHEIFFHCDATQIIGRLPFNTDNHSIDMITLSSHKIYGPKGCGALVATRDARKHLTPIIHGGGQERDLRSGTQNVPAIAGFGEACMVAVSDGLSDAPRQRSLRDAFEKKIAETIPDISINGIGAKRLPNTSNIRLRGALADAVMNRLSKIEISTGSACSSSTMEPSHVLLAMGLDRTAADESIRVSIGRHTTMNDIDVALSDIAQAVEFVRQVDGRQMNEKHIGEVV